jgi:dinuclear metal center YbgI/SA1388 family protein
LKLYRKYNEFIDEGLRVIVMGIELKTLVAYINELLRVNEFVDYCPNGLQVQGADTVKTVITGVTASEALIDEAIARGADAIVVHHGYFWKGESSVVTGMKARRLKKLLENNISLLAYHLPLDAHPVLGNNRQLADYLGFEVQGGLDDGKYPVGYCGRLVQPVTAARLADKVSEKLHRQCLLVGDGEQLIESLAWCTGAAQSYIDLAIDKGVQCFISGEISEQTVHICREMNVVYLACGHHATERYGVKALGEHLACHFALDCHFIDIDNPV